MCFQANPYKLTVLGFNFSVLGFNFEDIKSLGFRLLNVTIRRFNLKNQDMNLKIWKILKP